MQEHIGRYEVRRELGRGGMAAVYLAFDPRFRRQVAIKVMPRQFTFDPRYLERFQNEAHTIASLEHPAIVPVHDFGEHEDAPFLVMRYMSGGTLQDRMSGEPLSLDEVIHVLERLAPALDKAHEMGIIHRDLKPANILFDDDGFPYLADFGIARLAEATQTMTVVGTPAYMSPEQVEGDVEPDGRSDIYSLGVMVYELLTGRQPYKGSTPTKQMVAHLLEPLPDILQDNPNLPPEVQQVMEKAMAKDREERYDTASDMVAGLIAAQAATSEDVPAAAAAAVVAAQEEISAPQTVPEEQTAAPPAAEIAAAAAAAVPDAPPQTGGAVPPPPAAPAAQEDAKPGGLPIWVWGIGALALLAVAILGISFLVGGNGEDATESAREPAPEVAAAAGDRAATETTAPEPTLESPTHTPTLEPPTHTPPPESTAELEEVAAAVDATNTAVVEPTATETTTETAVPSDTPTASATPEPEIQTPQFVVGFESVNVRRGPGGDYRSIAIRYAGDVLEVIGRNSNASWLVVSLGDDRSGWISNVVGDLQGDIGPLEIPLAATIPPRPTATNTNTPTPVSRGSATPTVTRLPLPATIVSVETAFPLGTVTPAP